MTLANRIFTSLILVLMIALCFAFRTHAIPTVLGEAQSGTSAFLKSATTTVVGPQSKKLLFLANPSCKSRIITTRGTSAINIVFGTPSAGNVSTSTVSGAIGHLQLASTTVAYNSGLYGCGEMRAFGWASSTITISEF